MSIKIDKLEDLLTLNTDTMKSPDKSRLLTRIKQLIKLEDKIDIKSDEEALKLPYEGIGVVDNKLATIRFDLGTKEARIVEIEEDSRTPVIGATALQRLKILIRNQREL